MSRIQQDQFVDEEDEECCPLCVEEFDLSDRNFRPCPCGYQICQFCFNNIKTTMNGLCPACRRPYDDATIEWKTISPEEMARHKQQIAQKAKKNAQMRQKEAQKAEADSLSRKHLAGLRVVQKNLVYVTGLTPTIREDRLLDTLRGDDYFGQYGKIIKIVVSKARENAQHQQSVGVYVTFARKVDAEACIKAVDGSQNGDRTLRAQYGTTKYCSAYLRGEQCNNRNCMFLHEPGEDNDSFTRQDLSMMNSLQTQQPAQSSTSRPAPPAHHGPAVAAATPMNRQDSNDTPSPTQDAPGLPATASWGRAALERRASRSTIASNPSPMVTNATPVQAPKASKSEEPSKKKSKEKEKDKEKEKEKENDKEREKEREKEKEKEKEKEQQKEKEKAKSAQNSKSATPQPAATAPTSTTARPIKSKDDAFGNLLKLITASDFKFVFSSANLSEEEFKAIVDFPQLLDPNGGAKRRAMREKEEELALQREAETDTKLTQQQQQQQVTTAEREENEATVGGSLQLGGEPEDGHEPGSSHANQHTIAPPGQQGFGGNLFGQSASMTEEFGNLGMNNRGLTAQQQQQLLLSNFKSSNQSSGLLSNMQGTPNHQHSLSGNTPGHTRHTSRFSFANDSASASANVQPVANQKLMSQQNSMMPKNANQFNQMSQHQGLGGQFFSNVQGPPPGLKPTSTPPVSGTGMFGQGHGFATGGLGYGANPAGRNNNDAMYQDLLRGRNLDGGARGMDAGKQTTLLSAEDVAPFNVDALVNETDDETMPPIPRTTLGAPFFPSNRGADTTSTVDFPNLEMSHTQNKESKSQSGPTWITQTASSAITPAVPAVSTPPVVPATPKRTKKTKQESRKVEAGASLPTVASNTAEAGAEPKTPARSELKAGAQPKTPGEKSLEAKQDANKSHALKVLEAKSSPGVVPNEPVKAKTNKKKAVIGTENSPKKDPQKAIKDGPASSASPKPSEKRKAPGKLDLTAAFRIIDNNESTATSAAGGSAQTKSTGSVMTSSIMSPPRSPATVGTGSPVKRTTAPRTLRVVPTPKAETPPTLPAASAPTIPPILNVDKLRSRQASIASINQPSTPVSDLISDTASITSTSFSRANSPPPLGGKVGTAPVRKKTKSQAKKDRQERKRQIEEENIDENKSDVEIVQAPIVGRKKKTKKPSSVVKPTTSATKSHPPSPKPATVEEEHSDTPIVETKQVPSAKASVPATPEPELASEQPKERREITAQGIMAELQRRGELVASTLEFFKPLSSSLAHASRNSQSSKLPSSPDLKIHFTEADLEDLANKKPVRLNGYGGKPDSRTLITPNGKFFWGLSEELEQKALDLERQIDELKGHARFHPRKPTSYGQHHGTSQPQSQELLPEIAAILKESNKKVDAAHTRQKSDVDSSSGPLGPTGLFLPPVRSLEGNNQRPPAPPQQTPADAGAYLNQFVLPKSDNLPPNQPRPEMAAVGGPPGSGTSNISVKGNQFAKAARAVVEGGGLGNTEIDGMGTMAADLLGGVFVHGLESLVGAGLGFPSSNQQRAGLDARGGGAGIDMQGLMNAFESSAGLGGLSGMGLGGYAGNARRGRGSVLSMEEAEQAMLAARKEHDVLEKKLSALIKKNRKLALGGKA